ncbi:pectate lyase, PelA/Pel-15E family [Microbulbifer donghaiensis]|uniref:Pectate lyase, PelA/Pel-15E family n=1 Tax=Microbulbifer donghaiensis TaxID=494016 RepID=A0A1M4Z8A1_9GAMM|nr:pectate lyase [Microbulbifer donghaiensis]SHF14250.1 pectate lyase, PelA/Pel-15E family [Microbulbifer donghaiensis]
MKISSLLLGGWLLLAGGVVGAEVAGEMQPAQTLAQYRELSATLRQLDRAQTAAELSRLGLERPLPPRYAKRFGFDPRQPAEFYRTPEGRRIADAVLSYQTPSGGWSKRTDMGASPRQAGQAFGVEKNYIPTFDNSATSTQFWIMARAYGATGDKRYAAAAERALRLILLAQYPNGGWPQSFPLRGKYHELLTFNDGVTFELLSIVRAAAQSEEGLQFLPEALRARAADSLQRGLQMLLKTQVVSDGRTTIWGAQHDPETLKPAAARAFEPASLATAESADLVLFLMELERPSVEIKRAIESAHDWFAANQKKGYRWAKGEHDYKELLPAANTDPLWARFYEIGSNRPIFGDRDGAVYYDIRKVSQERLRGYGWYTEHPYKVLKRFPDWRERHKPQKFEAVR